MVIRYIQYKRKGVPQDHKAAMGGQALILGLVQIHDQRKRGFVQAIGAQNADAACLDQAAKGRRRAAGHQTGALRHDQRPIVGNQLCPQRDQAQRK